jgi:hypothetical protein
VAITPSSAGVQSQIAVKQENNIMNPRPIVPKDFAVPERLVCDGFHLRMLSVGDLIKDYEAVIASRETLPRILPPGKTWPAGLTLTEDLIDLGWHQREFTLRSSFAFTVMTSDETECLGCCYIDPSDRLGYDVAAWYWGRGDRLSSGLEERIGFAFRDWLKRNWPFKRVAYPGRDISWDDWLKLTPAWDH